MKLLNVFSLKRYCREWCWDKWLKQGGSKSPCKHVMKCVEKSGLDGDVRIWHEWARVTILTCGTASWPRVCCPLGLFLLPTLQALADAIRVNKTIKKVDLSYNEIGDEGVKARAQPGGVMAVGPWKENDRIEEFNQTLQMEIASSAFFLGTWGDFCVFREPVLARTFRSFFVLWIGGSTCKLRSLIILWGSLPLLEPHPLSGRGMWFWMYFRWKGSAVSDLAINCWKKAGANYYSNL